MKKLILVANIAFFIACNNSTTKNGNINEPQVAKSGKEIYTMYCVACHGADGTLAFSGAKDLSVSTLDLETRKLQITNGKGVMNAFKDILTPEEIDSVAVYIEQLRVSK